MHLPAFAPVPVIKEGVEMERESNVVEIEFNLDQPIDATTDDDRELEENLLQDTELDNSNNRQNLLQDAEIDNSNGNGNLLQDTKEVDNSSREELPAFVTTCSGQINKPPFLPPPASDCKVFTVGKSATPLVAHRQRLPVKITQV